MGDRWIPWHRAGRKRPLYYSLAPRHLIYVLGHYESPCGGCDTIGSARAVYDLTTSLHTSDNSILCEGLLLSEDAKWSMRLATHLRVIYLATSIEECLSRVDTRRRSNGNNKPLDPANTVNRVSVIERSRVKLEGAGVVCRGASVGQAVNLILRWLNADGCV